MLACWLAVGAACGGSSGSQVAEGGIGGTGISSGSVTGFGSYFVTGTEWSLAATGVVEIDGSTAGYDDGDLRLGMYLRVDGERSADGSTAASTLIRYDEAILGAVEQPPFEMGPDRRGFTVLGQPVVVDAGITVFVDTGFDALAMDDVIEVSGPVGDGGILATRVERRGSLQLGATFVEFKGEVVNLGASQFELGAATVSFDCGGATDCTALPGGAPSAGQLVEVEGLQTADGADPAVDALVIRTFTPFAAAVGDDADGLEVEGVIDDFAGLASFSVHGVSVDASAARLDPADPGLFGEDVYVEVEGDRRGGVLQAHTLRLLEGRALVAARIASRGLDRRQRGEIVLLAEGIWPLPGSQALVVEVGPSTRLVNESSAGDPDLKLADLLVGDFVIVRGIASGSRIRATDLRRREPDDVRLRGPVASVDRSRRDGVVGYSALGILVELVQGTTAVPGGDVDAFLAGLAVGDLLEAVDAADGSEETFDVADEVAAP